MTSENISASSSSYKMNSDTNKTSSHLSDFLWHSPLQFNCHFDESAKQAILKQCYESLWMANDDLMKRYFFSSKEELQHILLKQSQRHDGKEQNTVIDPTLWHTNAIIPTQDFSSQKGRQCGHVFRKGEPVYRCRNCGLDDTCVFCSKCFHATDHDGHDILFSVSPGSGGCCDCGDPEAWKIPLQCKIHSSEHHSTESDFVSNQASVDPALIDSIRTTIASVLNFLLDTFALAPDEVALNLSTEVLIKNNQEQRTILTRMGIPHQTDINTSILVRPEEDVDMDKESDDIKQDILYGSSSTTHTVTKEEGEKELYACIAWNDEAHAFSHVLESIMTATGWQWQKAKQIVDVIHVHGREIIAVSDDIAELRKIAAPLSAINLGVTIRPAKDTFREQVCGLLVDWLNEIINGRTRFFRDLPDGDAIVRNILCEELCAGWELRLPLALLAADKKSVNKTKSSDGVDAEDGEDEEKGTTEDGMRDDTALSETVEDVEMFETDDAQGRQSGLVANRNPCDVASIDWDPAAMVNEYQQLRTEEIEFGDSLLDKLGKKPSRHNDQWTAQERAELATMMQREFEEKLRLDYFMLYDLKLWKEVRISLRELYIASLASNPHFKKILGKRLARNYARLAESFLLRDREPENSIILFSVQLLTVPTVSDLLVHHYYFFGLICSTLTAFFLTDRLYLLLPSQRTDYPSRINCESRAFRTRRYFNAFHDLRYIMNVDMIKRVLAQDPLYLRQYLDLVSLFQGMNAQVCQKDTHVEYESEIWVNAFNVTLQIAKCCRQFSDCFSMLPFSTDQEKSSTVSTIVRAVSRVLKAIMEWGQVDEEEEEMEKAKQLAQSSTTTGNSAPAQKIYGAMAQEFHTVSLKYTEPFEVIKYNVATQPVSFHHPLHWLLSGLLECAHLLTDDVLLQAGWEGGFKEVITLFHHSSTASPSVLLSILDYPIRTIVFSSQIRAGVWVRNGYGIRNQAHHYRDISLRENTYDADVFLLQLGFATLDSNRFLATLLDRFHLISWFLGTKTHETYDHSQTVFMVEELLNLLIVISCERANVSGMSILDKIRREIIHSLCLGSSAYSELTKHIPERITEHPEFDRILNQVAHFKSPDGVNDHGTYELKNEYFECVDTYFWHFSRNNREEAESIFKARWKKQNPDRKEEEFFILPKVSTIASGPFEHMNSFLQSSVFVQMLSFALWNIYTGENHKSDTILDQSLHLILLALTDENFEDTSQAGVGKFYDYVCSLQFTVSMPATSENGEAAGESDQNMSLFDILVVLYRDERYAEISSRLHWIFEKLIMKGTPLTQQRVQDWKLQYQEEVQKNSQQDSLTELSEVERKKLAAKERQMKIMAQFAQAQSQFMEQNEFLYEDEDDTFEDAPEAFSSESEKENSAGTIHRFCSYPTGTCIVCQEDVNDRSLPYGLLGLIQTSNIMRETPMDNLSLMNDIYKMGPNLDTEWEDRQCLDDVASTVPGFPAHLHKTGLYASSCGHLMHIKCFEVYCNSIDSRHAAQLTRNHPENRSRKEFMCPLCKSLGNILLPVFWKGKKESYPGVLTKTEEANFATFYKSEVNQVVAKLKNSIIASSRHTQNRKSGRDTSATSRMKDVMTQLLPNLPTIATTTTPTATGPPTTITPPFANAREWAPTTFPTRLPVAVPFETNTTQNTEPQQPRDEEEPEGGDQMNTEEDELVRDSEAMLMRNTYHAESLPLPDGRLGPFENDTLHSTAMVSALLIKKSYHRLLDVLGLIYKEICTDETQRDMSTAAENVDMLWGIMGYTIAGVEIAARGSARSNFQTEENATYTLFDQIPTQTQTLLRILSDTVMAYTTLMCSSGADPKHSFSTNSIPMARVGMFCLGRMRQLFEVNVDDVVNLPAGPSQKIVLYDNAPLLEDDPFMILTELSLHLVPMTQADIFPFVRTLLLAEFAKTAVGLLQDHLVRQETSRGEKVYSGSPCEPSHDIAAAKTFAFSLMDKLQFTPEEAQMTFKKFDGDACFCALLKFFALPFLRRTLILMIVRFGLVVPPADFNIDSGTDELDRLLNLLQLPKFTDLLQPTLMTESLLHYWCSQHLRESERRIQVQEGLMASISASRLNPISLDLPIPFQLIALPKRLDLLFDESMKRVCQKCGTVPSEPAVCLFCGTFVCSQSFCCAEDEEGECNLHTLECGGEIGVFLSIKRCVLILLHNGNGWFMSAPYLDPHGEVDQGLRHGRPQYLNTKRYAEIRKLWLQHNIPIYVARQIEANYDIGGWTTL
ncbi:hypothetical protein BD560DRAFT_350498 [Blakeslea trispora]|nr:hypothetical protein BD560DRAFT_350498 [Blakeslea trispora]